MKPFEQPHISLSRFAPETAEFAMSASDEVFATVRQLGRTVLDTALSGITSLRQLIAEVLKALGAVSGLVTIMVRNRTQGTTTRRVIRIASARQAECAAGLPSARIPAGVQLRLPL